MSRSLPLRRLLAAVAILAGVAAAPASAAAPACRPAPGDAQAVEHAVRSLYAALAHDDAAEVSRITAPDFYAYDVGRRFSAPELAAAVRQAHASGVTLDWNLGPIDTHLGCDLAWAAWENHGHVGPKNALQPMNWLESAVLKREHRRWVVEFLHSTRVPPAK